MTLYKEYIKEREDANLIEKPGEGFISYRIEYDHILSVIFSLL